jgi:hypothetical protein
MLSGASWIEIVESPRTGPGDSDRRVESLRAWTAAVADTRGAPHISQVRRDGWFANVHRGHWKVASVDPEAS